MARQSEIQVLINAKNNASQEFRNVGDSIGNLGKKFKAFGTKVTAIGQDLTKKLTLPIIAAATGAAVLASDFEASMQKIVGLVGIPQKQVDELKKKVLDLAPALGKSPKELADALFVVTSAGARGETAMELLARAAKAGAAGLGDTGDIARAATGSVNAWGEANLSAAEAVDIITATARAGNFETSELAQSLGRALPFAKGAKADFSDLGGAIALFTRTSGDANLAIQQSAALFRSFAAPTTQTIKSLKEIGLSTDQVREMMSKRGLVGTLKELDTRLGGNRDKLRQIIPESNAFSGALQILDASGSDIEATFGEVSNSAGITDEAFASAEKTTKQKFNKTLAGLQTTLITLGTTVLPLVNDFLGFLGEKLAALSDWFSKLSPTWQKVILFGLGFLAVLGPLLIIIGTLITSVGAIIGVFGGLAGVLGIGVLPLIGLLVAAIAAAIIIGILIIKNWDKIKAAAVTVFKFIVDKIVWFKDNWAQAIGFVIGFFASLYWKLPIYIAKAIIAIVNKIRSIDWGRVWKGVKDAAVSVFNFIKNIKWGDILKGIGKGIANAIIGLIEGAIQGAVSGVPGLGKLAKIKLPRLQYGTEFSPSGTALVGERGPELVNLPAGSKVTPNNQIGGSVFNISINVGTLIDSDHTRRNFAERLMEDIDNIASMKGKKARLLT